MQALLYVPNCNVVDKYLQIFHLHHGASLCYHYNFFFDHLLISLLLLPIQPMIVLLFVLWTTIINLLVILPTNVFLLALVAMSFLMFLNMHLLIKSFQRMMPSHQSFTTQDVCLLHNIITTFFNRHDVNLTS
jgi:hypothetical protein